MRNRHILWCSTLDNVNMMYSEYTHLSMEQLASLYLKAEAELKTALLEGKSWEELREKKVYLTQLALQLHQRNSFDHRKSSPADKQIRKENM